MISFCAIAATMVIAALLCVSVPLLRRPDKSEPGTSALVVSMHRKEWVAAERDFLSGRATKEEHAIRRRELERRIFADTARSSTRPANSNTATRNLPVALLAVLIPALACALYSRLGDPGALTLNDPPDERRVERPVSVELMVARLAYRLTDHAPNPLDASSWAILARSYSVLERPTDAVAAYQQAVALDPGNASLRADFADALATANNGGINAAAAGQIKAALSLDPDNTEALGLAATAAFDTHAYSTAIHYWEQQQSTLAADSPVAIQAHKNADHAIALSAVTANVSFDPAIDKPILPDATVIVTARSASGETLAERRITAGDLPAKVVLDDTLAPQPGAAMSANAVVTVEARLDHSATSGMVKVAPAQQNRSVNVVIGGVH